MLPHHVFLIGMPGSGKSSLARRTAEDLGLRLIDTDRRIEEEAGCSISRIFRESGEQAFRDLETALLKALAQEPPSLTATGGGLPLRPENRELMRAQGCVILIDRPLEGILRDIRTEELPLLTGKGTEAVRAMYEARIGLYRAAADRILDNGGTAEDGVRRLEALLRSLYPGSSQKQ